MSNGAVCGRYVCSLYLHAPVYVYLCTLTCTGVCVSLYSYVHWCMCIFVLGWVVSVSGFSIHYLLPESKKGYLWEMFLCTTCVFGCQGLHGGGPKSGGGVGDGGTSGSRHERPPGSLCPPDEWRRASTAGTGALLGWVGYVCLESQGAPALLGWVGYVCLESQGALALLEV